MQTLFNDPLLLAAIVISFTIPIVMSFLVLRGALKGERGASRDLSIRIDGHEVDIRGTVNESEIRSIIRAVVEGAERRREPEHG